ncbi:hypothetical protein [Aquibacillus albus]|uniref:NAD-dependent epimerase/dehydratase family protein n=1 Tax=Aquibacillus albus TaxID=1168171 RepID=A0ABS2MUJ3_9BACI|nr:hypothetical protein [Aquibacillus albus]MBM7569556.1 putative NAD-dependent epimerase/dehydratase family protein [Aquibacillus albus]
MRLSDKQTGSHSNHELHGMDLHTFMELEDNKNSIEIAQEFDVSLRDVKKIKKKLNRS